MSLNAESANRFLFPVTLAYVKWTLSTRKMTTQLVTTLKTKPFPRSQTRHSFRGRDALSWQKSMYQLFWSCQIRIWRREPKRVQKCSWSNSQGGILQCLVSPLPPAPHSSRLHTWLSKLNLPPLQSWRCVRRLRQLCQCWAPSHFIPHIPSLQRKQRRRAWRMVTCCRHPSQKWHLTCQTSEDGQIFQVYYYIAGIVFRHLPLTTCW